MPNKLPDSEIIKALEDTLHRIKGAEHLIVPKEGVKNLCNGLQNALDLIYRLQEKDKTRHKVFETKCEELEIAKAENERLKEKCFYCTEQANKKIGEIKAEAYKEFAERLIFKFNNITYSQPCEDVIDNLLKELMGENDGKKET